jgi:hypothetical protein
VHPSFSCASQADASATSLHMWGRKGRNSHRCACLCCRKLFQRRHSSQMRQLLPVGVRIPSIFSARVDPTIGARFSGPSKKTRVLFFHGAHSKPPDYRPAGSSAHDRHTRQRNSTSPPWRLAGVRKDSANAHRHAQGSRKRDGALGLTLSSLERSSGRIVAFCSLRTNRSAAQTHALTMRRAQARCTCKFALHNEGAAL